MFNISGSKYGLILRRTDPNIFFKDYFPYYYNLLKFNDSCYFVIFAILVDPDPAKNILENTCFNIHYRQ